MTHPFNARYLNLDYFFDLIISTYSENCEKYSAFTQRGHHKPTVERSGKIGGWGWGGTLTVGWAVILSICLAGDNTAEHSALFTVSHLMQCEGPFHDKWSPFLPESPFHQTPDPHTQPFSLLKVRVEVLFISLIFHTIISSLKSIRLKLHFENFWRTKNRKSSFLWAYRI